MKKKTPSCKSPSFEGMCKDWFKSINIKYHAKKHCFVCIKSTDTLSLHRQKEIKGKDCIQKKDNITGVTKVKDCKDNKKGKLSFNWRG